MQKKSYLYLLTALITVLPLLISRAHAVESTSAPSPSATPLITDEVVTENLKKRLQESLSQDTAESNEPAPTYRSFVGSIRDVIKNTLIVEDKDGKKNVMIKDDANIVRSPGSTTIKAENIRIEDYVIAIGTLKEDDELEAVRIIVSTDPLSTTNKISGVAKIVEVGKNSLTVSGLTTTDNQLELTLNTKSKLKTSLGESLTLDDLTVGDSIVYTAISAKDTLTLTSLMRIGFADAPQVQ